MSDPWFVPHFTFDGIVTAVSIIGGGLIFLLKLGGKLTRLDIKVEEHGIKLDKLIGVAEMQARHDERLIELGRRMNLFDERWEELRHGKAPE